MSARGIRGSWTGEDLVRTEERYPLASGPQPSSKRVIRRDIDRPEAMAVSCVHMPTPRVIGYFTSWGVAQRAYGAGNIPGSLLTHVNYAFANVSPTGECCFESAADSARDTAELRRLKSRHPDLRVLLSVGGWTFSKHFSEAVRTRETRERFIDSCLRMLDAHPDVFDGFDIDWEFPGGGGLATNAASADDRDNLTACMCEFRDRARRTGVGGLLLTMAIPAGAALLRSFDLKRLARAVDWFNVMAYDFAGPWSKETAFHAALHADPKAPDQQCVSSTIESLMTILPADKLVLGIPFYGRGWSGVGEDNHGLYQPFRSVPDGDAGEGCFSARFIAERLSSMGEYWDRSARAPWRYDASQQLMLSHENARSIEEKCTLIHGLRLGGAMIWELSLDAEHHSLLRTLHGAMSDPRGAARSRRGASSIRTAGAGVE